MQDQITFQFSFVQKITFNSTKKDLLDQWVLVNVLIFFFVLFFLLSLQSWHFIESQTPPPTHTHTQSEAEQMHCLKF